MHRISALLLLCLFSSSLYAGNFVARAYSQFTHSLARAMTDTYTEHAGLQLESVQVDYQGYPVSFQYHLWRLKHESVCGHLKGDMLNYSRCSKAAKAFFSETCEYLNRNPSNSWKYPKLKRLYCDAAIRYQPVIASIRKSAPVDKDRQRRQECSALIVKAMGNPDPRIRMMRDEACGK